MRSCWQCAVASATKKNETSKKKKKKKKKKKRTRGTEPHRVAGAVTWVKDEPCIKVHDDDGAPQEKKNESRRPQRDHSQKISKIKQSGRLVRTCSWQR